MTRISLTNDELITVRDAMRGLNTHIDELNRGQREKLVLTRHNQMLGVVVSLERFALYQDLESAVNAMMEAETAGDMQAHNQASTWVTEVLDKL